MATSNLPDTMSQDDPWAWLNWAQQRDPGTYGWDTNKGDAGSFSGGPAWWAGKVADGADPHATMTPEQAQAMADAGYTFRQARGPGYTKMWQVVGPDGKVIDQGTFQKQDGMHSKDWTTLGSVLAAGIGGAAALGAAGVGGGIGLGAGAGSGVGAGAAAAGEGVGTLGTISAGTGVQAAIPSVLEGGIALGSVPAVSGTVAGAGVGAGALGTMGTISAGTGAQAAIPSSLASGTTIGSVPAVSGTVASSGGAGLFGTSITAGNLVDAAKVGVGVGALAEMNKDPSGAAPDPALVESQLRAMGYQEQAVLQALKIMEAQEADDAKLRKVQQESAEFSLGANRTAFDQSQADREWLLNRRGSLTGLQDNMVREANSFNSEATQDSRAAAAQANVGQLMNQQQQAAMRNLAAMGAAPNSGQAYDLLRRSGIDAARQGVGAANDARLSARNEGRALTDRAANSLAGYPAMGMNATQSGANIAGNQLGLANSSAAGSNAMYGAMTGQAQAAGGLAGNLGASAANLWGQQANANFANQQARSENRGATYGLLGSLLASYSGSDRRLKTDIEPVGRLDNGLTVYRYRYKSGGPAMLGVMADEVEKINPQAVAKGVIAGGFDAVNYAML
jgi:hypothetical protein